ncbi:hypothetical protein P873_05180 [Arenimonas composti TR7-09 = DSM 18010]|uniref:Polymerase beta nucleotidyltransferase domain-containing protein n=1 Tax=Arenimonas composti TR7-09 = DSM 18010 TaxID=1121013 RepID=A0A091BJ20_9GAMM|nr:hypothetical protein P873_05180 [Arenimonas composti TR7-09 = DSM 18010]
MPSDAAPLSTADVLFTPVQQRVLGLVFGQPDRRFQSAELIRLAGAGTGAAHRLLMRLEGAGLVAVERVGNQKFYRANEKSPIYPELVGLITKTVGLAQPLRAALAPLDDRIRAAFVFGSIAKGGERAGSDVDLMVISDGVSYADLYAALTGVESVLARPVNPKVMKPDEWQHRRHEADNFISRIADQPRLFVIGSDDDLG